MCVDYQIPGSHLASENELLFTIPPNWTDHIRQDKPWPVSIWDSIAITYPNISARNWLVSEKASQQHLLAKNTGPTGHERWVSMKRMNDSFSGNNVNDSNHSRVLTELLSNALCTRGC